MGSEHCRENSGYTTDGMETGRKCADPKDKRVKQRTLENTNIKGMNREKIE